MATKEQSFLYVCSSRVCTYLSILFVKSLPVVFLNVIGWAIFSYVEDDLNLINCITKPKKVAALYQMSDSKERANILFHKLYNKTGQELTGNQSTEVYVLFATYFNVPQQVELSESLKIYVICTKWLRFSMLTSTTIGKLYTYMRPISKYASMLIGL